MPMPYLAIQAGWLNRSHTLFRMPPKGEAVTEGEQALCGRYGATGGAELSAEVCSPRGVAPLPRAHQRSMPFGWLGARVGLALGIGAVPNAVLHPVCDASPSRMLRGMLWTSAAGLSPSDV